MAMNEKRTCFCAVMRDRKSGTSPEMHSPRRHAERPSSVSSKRARITRFGWILSRRCIRMLESFISFEMGASRSFRLGIIGSAFPRGSSDASSYSGAFAKSIGSGLPITQRNCSDVRCWSRCRRSWAGGYGGPRFRVYHNWLKNLNPLRFARFSGGLRRGRLSSETSLSGRRLNGVSP